MKKLSLLVALILCVTIGGVYAAWEFAGNNIVDKHETINITMGTASSTGAPGVYTVDANFSIAIEPMDVVDPDTTETDANHKADILWQLNDGETVPQITFTFTPTESSSQDQKINGATSQFYFITSAKLAGSEMTYDDKDIFTFDATKTSMVTINKVNATGEVEKWTKQLDGSFTYTIDATEYISLTEHFLIDTLDDWNTFEKAVAGNILVYITDSVADPTV